MFTPRVYILLPLMLCISVFVALPRATDAETSTSTSDTASSTEAGASVSPDRVVELRGRFAPQTKNRIKNLLENIVHRGEATVDRFAHISARIESRIEKIKAQGGDTAAAEAALADANTARAAASDTLRTLTDRDVDVVVDAPVPHDALRLLRTRITNIQANLATAKEDLARAVYALSAPKAPVTASTTASTTPKKK